MTFADGWILMKRRRRNENIQPTNDWIVLLVSVAGTTANSSSSTALVYCVAELRGNFTYNFFFSLMCCACLTTCLNGCMVDREERNVQKWYAVFHWPGLNEYETRFLLYFVLLMTASEMILNTKSCFKHYFCWLLSPRIIWMTKNEFILMDSIFGAENSMV